MKNNKPVTWILIVALAGIWGTIFYNIYDSVSGGGPGEETAVVSIAPSGRTSADRFVYTDDVRDPFRATPAVVQRKPVPVAKTPLPIWIPPPLRLTGILLSNKKHTAVVESPDGATFFLKEGDTLRGVRILRIAPDSVNYSFNKKKGNWKLEGK